MVNYQRMLAKSLLIALALWPLDPEYISDGYNKFLDIDGYPAIQPPWGTLTAIDLNSGKTAWKIPLGEYPELAAKGLTGTGSENYGRPVAWWHSRYPNSLACECRACGRGSLLPCSACSLAGLS